MMVHLKNPKKSFDIHHIWLALKVSYLNSKAKTKG